MKTTITDSKIINLISKSFDSNGFLVSPNNRTNQRKARVALESGVNYYGEYFNGCDVSDLLLIIAYPNKSL